MSAAAKIILGAFVAAAVVFLWLIDSLQAAKGLVERQEEALLRLQTQLSSTAEALEARRSEIRELRDGAERLRIMLEEAYANDNDAAAWGRVCVPVSVLDIVRKPDGHGDRSEASGDTSGGSTGS